MSVGQRTTAFVTAVTHVGPLGPSDPRPPVVDDHDHSHDQGRR